MELHSAARLKRGFPTWDICKRYIDRLPLAPAQYNELLSRTSPRCALNRREAMAELHAALAGPVHRIDPVNPAFASVPARHALGWGALPTGAETTGGAGRHAPLRLPTHPAIRRRTMAPMGWPPRLALSWLKWSRPAASLSGKMSASATTFAEVFLANEVATAVPRFPQPSSP